HRWRLGDAAGTFSLGHQRHFAACPLMGHSDTADTAACRREVRSRSRFAHILSAVVLCRQIAHLPCRYNRDAYSIRGDSSSVAPILGGLSSLLGGGAKVGEVEEAPLRSFLLLDSLFYSVVNEPIEPALGVLMLALGHDADCG